MQGSYILLPDVKNLTPENEASDNARGSVIVGDVPGPTEIKFTYQEKYQNVEVTTNISIQQNTRKSTMIYNHYIMNKFHTEKQVLYSSVCA
jgi:hypothetical protein